MTIDTNEKHAVVHAVFELSSVGQNLVVLCENERHAHKVTAYHAMRNKRQSSVPAAPDVQYVVRPVTLLMNPERFNYEIPDQSSYFPGKAGSGTPLKPSRKKVAR